MLTNKEKELAKLKELYNWNWIDVSPKELLDSAIALEELVSLLYEDEKTW